MLGPLFSIKTKKEVNRLATKKTTTSKNGTQPKRGRGQPKSQKYDKELFEDLCKIQCTEREICQLFHTADTTLRTWIGETYQDKDGNPRTWDDVYGEYSAGGKMSLRRSQFRLAEKMHKWPYSLVSNIWGRQKRPK